jgi:hypothetical protein
MMLLDTRVPDDSANPHAEICHAFVYRWLIGRKKILPDARSDPMTRPFNGVVMKPILWPAGGHPVRVSSVNQVNAGDIVGFFAENGDVNASSGLVLDDPNSSTRNGTPMDQWQWNGGLNPQWFLVPA